MRGRRKDKPFAFEGMTQAEVQEGLEAIAIWDRSLSEMALAGDIELAITASTDSRAAHADFPTSPRPGPVAMMAIQALIRKARPTGHVWDNLDGRMAKYPEGLTLVIPARPISASARAALEGDPDRKRKAAATVARFWSPGR